MLSFPVELYVPVKFAHTLEVPETALSAGPAKLSITGFLENYEAVFQVTDSAGNVRDTFSCDGKVLTWTAASAGPHKLTVSDKRGKYSPYIVSFLLTTQIIPAKAGEAALVKAEDASDADFACYLASITSVNVSGSDYAAMGKGSVAVIDKEGEVDFSTAAFTGLAGQTATITVTAQGYAGGLTLTVSVPETLPASERQSH